MTTPNRQIDLFEVLGVTPEDSYEGEGVKTVKFSNYNIHITSSKLIFESNNGEIGDIVVEISDMCHSVAITSIIDSINDIGDKLQDGVNLRESELKDTQESFTRMSKLLASPQIDAQKYMDKLEMLRFMK